MSNYFDGFESEFGKSPYMHKITAEHEFEIRCFDFLTNRLFLSKTRAEAISKTLIAAMSDTSLHYHTIVHILSIFDFARINGIELTTAQQLAIWFHDSVYEVGANKLNELRSAEFMRALIGESPVTDRASQIITMTACFNSEEKFDEDIELVLDLDLCSFSCDRFDVYDACIEKEFAPVYGEAFKAGRKDFFNQMLSKKKIYRTDQLSQFEEKARLNLTKLRDSL